MSDSEDGTELIAAFQKSGTPSLPQSTRKARYIRVSPVRNRDEYTFYEPKDEVEGIIREFSRKGEIMYEVRIWGDKTREITVEELLKLPGGPDALQNSQRHNSSGTTSPNGDTDEMKLRKRVSKPQENDFVDISAIILSSSGDDSELAPASRRIRNGRARTSIKRGTGSKRSSRASRRSGFIELSTSDDTSESDDGPKQRKHKHNEPATCRSARQPRNVRASDEDEDEDIDEEEGSDSSVSDILRSDVLPGRKRKRRMPQSSKPEKMSKLGVRQSDRLTRATNNMQEVEMDDIYRSDSPPKATAPKASVVREVFPTLPRSDLFRSRHVEGCEACFDGPNVAPLVYCQGCSLAYHKNCLGNRANRDHLVTKVGDEHFVLQCKRCINMYRAKDSTAPDLSRCQDCGQQGASCKAFRPRKTTQQEMKDREENGGQDPIVDVQPELINNVHNVLFRCTKCARPWHYHHLPPLSQYAMDINRDEDELADERFREYSRNWLCKECGETTDRKVGAIIAWRPSDVESYRPGTSCHLVKEDDKQYLVKWENLSYFQAAWYSGAWTWGVTASSMRKAFLKREAGPKMRTEDAIPEEYLRIDIVLDIKYTSYVDVRSEEIDKARIKEVDKALLKYKGLGYEDTVWENVPTAEDGDRWLDFVTAYNDWVAGRYLKFPKQSSLKSRLEKARSMPFTKLERQKQPNNLVGGELMKYQIRGLNWIYNQWYEQKNGILADEMGLGKTIQVISFMATLIQEHGCFPFVVVVPNSTCANWRREIKQWAPSLRVVAYFGSSQSRDMAYRYEMYPDGSKELRCHVIVTSYEAATDPSCRRFFRSVNWAGLIVDEGQRLKNDSSQLYSALNGVKAPFRLLLTGTPLQNNARELFNLLQFLDQTINAAELEEKYQEMTSENIKELHSQIRPFILRRTKAEVLTFLPPLGQVILPISMSHLQKQLYKTILSKSPELLKALFSSAKTLKQQERANLSNILMQLRKCLCHPFVYSRDIEERTDVAAVSHRNLVEASAKLTLLELLLPKLKERGHRVLIFSQFLDMLDIIEDFLDGLQLAHQRLDGTMGSLEKQKRIDQFNAPDSPLFAFLLSTRSGGVGINLATADTVIILDPDWNPHQDIQAIARAHRIGQKKKVLCLQLMTRASVEEKIMQMGRKKMALDHVVVEQLETKDIEDHDVESILKFGAAEIFKDDNTDLDIRYDEASIDKLLDRSQIENTRTGGDDSAESQFSFARIWANEKSGLQDDFDNVEEEVAPDPGVWDKILKERQAIAAAEALARAEAMGRGRRAKVTVDYTTENGIATTSIGAEDVFEDSLALPSPVKKRDKRRKKRSSSESDTDFQTSTEDENKSGPASPDVDVVKESKEMQIVGDNINSGTRPKTPGRKEASQLVSSLPTKFTPINLGPQPKYKSDLGFGGIDFSQSNRSNNVPARAASKFMDRHSIGETRPNSLKPSNSAVKSFKRAILPVRSPLEYTHSFFNNRICPACHKNHTEGACELKAAGVEHCGLCGLAHYGYSRTCPHIRSETQVRAMLEALKSSPEDKTLVDAAVKYLRGVKGTLVQQKKRDREKAALLKNGVTAPPPLTGATSYAPPPQKISHGSITPPAPYPPPPHIYDNPATYSQPITVAPGSVGNQLQNQHHVAQLYQTSHMSQLQRNHEHR